MPVIHGDGEDFLLGLALREGLRLVFVDRVGIGPVLVQDDGTEFGFQRNVAVGVRLGIADEGRAGAFLRPDVEGQGVGGVGILASSAVIVGVSLEPVTVTEMGFAVHAPCSSRT